MFRLHWSFAALAPAPLNMTMGAERTSKSHSSGQVRATHTRRAWRKMPDMIPQDLLEILVCPLCKQPLTLQEKTLRDKDSQQSLKCKQCRRVYPVRDDIPILLVDEATIDPS
jgi:uncharacterized protein